MNKSGFSYDGLRVLTCDALTETGLIRHGFSTRKGGESKGKFSGLNLGRFTLDDRETILENYRLFCDDLGICPEHLVLPKQVHSKRVLAVTAQDAGKGLFRESDLPDVDALITNEPGVCLATFYADCTPILLLDPVKKVIASVHSGWRGTLQKITGEAVLCMQERYGSNPAHVLAAMGPSIKQCHFEVDEDVYLAFGEEFPELIDKCTLKKGQKFHIDTDALNVDTLQRAGLLTGHIFRCGDCTYCESETYFSHRREGSTGRMCAVIELI